MKFTVFGVHLYRGARDNDVDAPEMFHGCRDRGFDLGRIGHVGRKREGVRARVREVLGSDSTPPEGMPTSATFAPSFAILLAVASPIPLPAPVMKATFPSSWPLDIDLPPFAWFGAGQIRMGMIKRACAHSNEPESRLTVGGPVRILTGPTLSAPCILSCRAHGQCDPDVRSIRRSLDE